MEIKVAGENSLVIYADNQSSMLVNEKISAWIASATKNIEHSMSQFLIDIVPSYASILVIYDAYLIDHCQLRHLLHQQLDKIKTTHAPPGKLVELPVYYDAESTPDLTRISENCGLSKNEIIEIHQNGPYQVHAMGFSPGFGFLGQVDARIAMPRLATPRKKVPKGAVAIADRQTAVYPCESPGGWNLIGLCPLPMFKKHSSPATPMNIGDKVTFKSINKEEFLKLGGKL